MWITIFGCFLVGLARVESGSCGSRGWKYFIYINNLNLIILIMYTYRKHRAPVVAVSRACDDKWGEMGLERDGAPLFGNISEIGKQPLGWGVPQRWVSHDMETPPERPTLRR